MATGEGGEGTFSGYSQVCPREAERERKTGRGHCWWLRRCAWRLPAAVPAQPGARSPEPALALGRGGGWPGSPAPGTEARAWGLGRRRSLSWSPRPLHYTAFVSLCCFCFCFFFFLHTCSGNGSTPWTRVSAPPTPGLEGRSGGTGLGVSVGRDQPRGLRPPPGAQGLCLLQGPLCHQGPRRGLRGVLRGSVPAAPHFAITKRE